MKNWPGLLVLVVTLGFGGGAALIEGCSSDATNGGEGLADAGADEGITAPDGGGPDAPTKDASDSGEAGEAGVETPFTTLSLVAGGLGGVGYADGVGANARFNRPQALAVDASGNVYVADSYNCTIRRITPAGAVTTVAGAAAQPGYADGTGPAARFNVLRGIAFDASGNLYVADKFSHTIRKMTPAGVVTTVAGTAGQAGHTDGTGADARFDNPDGIAVDASGNVYVADPYRIRKMTPAGVVTTLAGVAGQGIAVDASGNLYIASTGTETIERMTPAGVVTTLAGMTGQFGSTDGAGSAARFHDPQAIALDASGNVYVADSGNATIRKVTPEGIVTTLAGTSGELGSTDGQGAAARFRYPQGIALNASGDIYVADSDNSTIRKVTPAGVVTTLAASADQGSADGSGAAARFRSPYGVAMDASGNVYVADTKNNTIRKMTPAGTVTTLAGTAGLAGSVDATGDGARFLSPSGLAVDASGNIYVADSGNSTIRRVTPAGTVTTLAGKAGQVGRADGTGADARFDYPTGIAVDSAGNVYVAAPFTGAIRRVTPAGVVTTLAGGTLFNEPYGVAVDSAGNVYVAETGSDTIRKIAPGGIVTALAGAYEQAGAADGVGADARFDHPKGVAVDSAGNVYVADTGSGTIRGMTPAGVVTTLVGAPGQHVVTPGPLPGRLNGPVGITVAPNGDLLVVDSNESDLLRVH